MPADAQTGTVPKGKAMVFVEEDVAHIAFSGITIRIGVDGKWVGATTNLTYIGFPVEPGVHHLCVSVQGLAMGKLENGITLRALEAKAGETYYIRVRETQGQAPPLVFVDMVDADEGQLLLQTMAAAAWRVK